MHKRIVTGLAIVAGVVAVLLFAYEQSLEHGVWGAVALAAGVAAFGGLAWLARGKPRYRHLDEALDANHPVRDVVRDRGLSIHLPKPDRCSTCGQLVTPDFAAMPRRS